MLRLYVLRHGKSDWEVSYTQDSDRPLAPRGEQAAALMGRFLTRLDEAPELILTSPAIRAVDTVRHAREAGGWSCPVEQSTDLYTTGPSQVFAAIRRHGQAAAAGSVLAAGHEPWCSELVGELTGAAQVHFPTAALARVDLSVAAWEDAELETGTLRWLVTPKLLQRAGVD